MLTRLRLAKGFWQLLLTLVELVHTKATQCVRPLTHNKSSIFNSVITECYPAGKHRLRVAIEKEVIRMHICALLRPMNPQPLGCEGGWGFAEQQRENFGQLLPLRDC